MMPLRVTTRVSLTAAILAGLLTWSGGSPARGASPPEKLPPWTQVKQAVVAHFEALPDYQPGVLIVASEVREVLGKLERLGWRVAEGKEILGQVPADGEFLAASLRSPAGRKFIRGIGQSPDAYDRLDRLSRLPRGQRMVRDLIRGPDGYKMIEYMTKTPGGEFLGKQLSKAPDGRDFNEPTGRIYTVKMLQARLKESYEKARKAAPQNSGA